MRKIMIALLVLFTSGVVYAGQTNPGSDYHWKSGYNIVLDRGNITLSEGLNIDTPVSASVIVDTNTTNITISNSFMVFYTTNVIGGTGLVTPSGVLFSTSAYSVGTHFTMMVSSGTLTLTDGDAYGLSLGASTRDLGVCDLIELILRPAYGTMNQLWNERSFVDGDDD